MNAPPRPADTPAPARRLTDRALHLWRAIRALPPEVARAQLALFVGDAVRLAGEAGTCPVARRIDSLAPVARAMGQPVEVEGWETQDPDAPVAWRAVLLPLEAPGAALAVTSRYDWAGATPPTSALPAAR